MSLAVIGKPVSLAVRKRQQTQDKEWPGEVLLDVVPAAEAAVSRGQPRELSLLHQRGVKDRTVPNGDFLLKEIQEIYGA